MQLRLKALTLMLSVLLIAGLVVPAAGSPKEELQDARKSFLAQDYERAIGQFTALLYPTSRLAEAPAIAEAHLLLGVSYFETQRAESAAREFEEALFLDSSLSLDAALFSAEAIRFFDEKKADISRKAADAAEKERLARKEQALNRALQNAVVIEHSRYWVNFMPFGLGQFQNGDTRKGRLFFVGQAVTGGVSAGLFSYQVFRYGFGGKVPRDEVDTVNLIQTAELATSAMFYALWAWGIIDSLSNYEYAIKRQVEDLNPDDLKDIFDTENENNSSMPILIPMLGEDSASASLMWEF